MKSVRQMFKVRDRVEMTDECFQQCAGRTRTRTGTVVGFGKEPFLVRVLRDGMKMPARYSSDFWVKAKESK